MRDMIYRKRSLQLRKQTQGINTHSSSHIIPLPKRSPINSYTIKSNSTSILQLKLIPSHRAYSTQNSPIRKEQRGEIPKMVDQVVMQRLDRECDVECVQDEEEEDLRACGVGLAWCFSRAE
jgi:hypothetical protein